MNVGKVSDEIKKLLKQLQTTPSNDMMKEPMEDFFKIT